MKREHTQDAQRVASKRVLPAFDDLTVDEFDEQDKVREDDELVRLGKSGARRIRPIPHFFYNVSKRSNCAKMQAYPRESACGCSRLGC